MVFPNLGMWFDDQTSTGIAKTPFTVQSLFTAAGATTAVFTVTTVLRSLISKLDPRWTAAVLSLLIMLVEVKTNGDTYSVPNILVAVINAAVIYAAAVGVNNVTTNPRSQGGVAAAPAAPAAVQARPGRIRWFD